MTLFHRHHWIETGRAFVPPRQFADIRGNPMPGSRAYHAINDALYGATFVSLRCEGCGDVLTRKLPGKFVDA